MTNEQKVNFFYKCQADKCANWVVHYVDRNRLLGLKTALYNWKEENQKDLDNIERDLQCTCSICNRYKEKFNDSYDMNEKIVE